MAPKARVFVCSLFLSPAILSGCVYIPPVTDQVRSDDIVPIEVGHSTKQDVVEILGSPNVRERDDTYIWQWRTHKGHIIVAGPYGGGGGFAVGEKENHALAEFDDADVLTKFSHQSSEAASSEKMMREREAQLQATRLDPVKKFERGLPGFALEYSPNGKFLAAGDHTVGVKVWDLDTGLLANDLDRKKFFGVMSVFSVDFSPDSKRVLAGTVASTAVMWDVTSGEVTCEVPEEGRFTSVSFSPDGERFAVGEYFSGDVALFNAETCQEISRASAGSKPSWVSVDHHPDQEILVSFSGSRLSLWDSVTGAQIASETISNLAEYQWGRIIRAKVSHNGNLIAINTCDHLEFWKIVRDSDNVSLEGPVSVTLLPYFSGQRFFCSASLAFLPDDQSVLVGIDGALIRVDPASGKILDTFSIPSAAQSQVSLSPDGTALAAKYFDDVGLFELPR